MLVEIRVAQYLDTRDTDTTEEEYACPYRDRWEGEESEGKGGEGGDDDAHDKEFFLPHFLVSQDADRVFERDEWDEHDRENDADLLPVQSEGEEIDRRIDGHRGVEKFEAE